MSAWLIDPNQAANSSLVDLPGMRISAASTSAASNSASESGISGHLLRTTARVGSRPLAYASSASSCFSSPLPKRGTRYASRFTFSLNSTFAVFIPTGSQNSFDGLSNPRPCFRAFICSSLAVKSGSKARSAASCDCAWKVKANWSILIRASYTFGSRAKLAAIALFFSSEVAFMNPLARRGPTSFLSRSSMVGSIHILELIDFSGSSSSISSAAAAFTA
mmetsp:Transcript_40044/g.96617  ORF Transcript_40044/g.96617 Transcript_40044/m.96617 type:complete len:220 (-) Transcript_40044:1143-1802(-)